MKIKNKNTIDNSNKPYYENQSVIKIHPSFITGLVEAEGCFSVSINKDKRAKYGRNVSLRFRIQMLKNEADLLCAVKAFFNCGTLWYSKDDFVSFIVNDISSIKNIILPHFLQYPLRGTKHLDFLSFKEAFNIVDKKEHLLEDNLFKLSNISKGMNTGREYSINYCNPSHTIRGNKSYIPIDGHYINGFISGDGCIGLDLRGKNFGRMYLHITQHVNNRNLLLEILDYFEKPLSVYKKNAKCLQITFIGMEFWDNILFKHFVEYPLHGSKRPMLDKLVTIRTLMLDNKHIIKVGKYKQWNPEYQIRIEEIWKS